MMRGSKGFVNRKSSARYLVLSAFILLTVTGCVRPEPPQQEAQQPPPEPLEEPAQPSPPLIAKLELQLENEPQDITLTPDSKLSIEVGETRQFKSMALDDNRQKRDDVTVTWTSENPDVATVDPLGRVTAVAQGKTTLTAFADGHSASVRVSVVTPQMAKLEIRSSSTTMSIGETVQLDLTATDTKNQVYKNITAHWNSDNTPVAQINKSGLVTAVKPGSATLTATFSGKTAALKMTVVPPSLGRLEIRPSEATIPINGFQQFKAIVIDEKNQIQKDVKISWQTDRPQIAWITNEGVLYALETGTVLVKATAKGKTASAKVSVVPPPAPE